MRNAAKRNAGSADRIAIHLQARGYRHQRECIGLPVADLDIAVVLRVTLHWQFDRDNDFVRRQRGVDVRRVAGKLMKFVERDAALPSRPANVHNGIERGQRHAHVGRMHGDAAFAGAEYRVDAVQASARRTARAGLALVAGGAGIVKVIASGALQQVAAGRGHVA